MEEITMMSRYDMEELKKIAKYLAGFDGVECHAMSVQRQCREPCWSGFKKPRNSGESDMKTSFFSKKNGVFS